jgi:LPS-assembly lipoprotein
MWWSKALVVLLVVALGPVGCGFRPLYAERPAAEGAVSSDLAAIRVLAIDDRSGQRLRNVLMQRLTPHGESAQPRYSLITQLTESSSGVAQSLDGSATLGNVTIIATFSLIETSSGRSLMGGSARAITSFRYFGPRYGSVALERDAQERSLVELGDDIRAQLAAYFASRSAGFKPETGQ